MTSIQPIQVPQYVTQPNYNAVKIEINNPEVKTVQEPIQKPVYTKPMYSYPEAPVYEIPKQSIYAPQSVQSSVVETPVKSAPIVPPPTVVQAPVAPEVKVVAPETIDIIKPEKMESTNDINVIISKLSDPDFEVQAKAMSSIAKVVQAAPQSATELLDVKVVDTLLGIMTRDTSTLQGPSEQKQQAREKLLTGKPVTPEEQADATTPTPLELAERNKQFSMFTVAILQKLYSSEIEKTANTVVPMTELPGAAGIVEQVKSNPNPAVRVAGLEALSYIQRPEYKKDLTTIFTVAQQDQDPLIKNVATRALDKLAAVANAPETTPEAVTAKA